MKTVVINTNNVKRKFRRLPSKLYFVVCSFGLWLSVSLNDLDFTGPLTHVTLLCWYVRNMTEENQTHVVVAFVI